MKWYVNGVEIRPSDHYQMFQEGDTVVLIIIHVDEDDIGEYVLRVGNELGEITCRTTITFDGEYLFYFSNVIKISDKYMWQKTLDCIGSGDNLSSYQDAYNSLNISVHRSGILGVAVFIQEVLAE